MTHGRHGSLMGAAHKGMSSFTCVIPLDVHGVGWWAAGVVELQRWLLSASPPTRTHNVSRQAIWASLRSQGPHLLVVDSVAQPSCTKTMCLLISWLVLCWPLR